MTIHDLKTQEYTRYKSIVSVFCPILNETVYFGGVGFKHLLYENDGLPRNINEQYLKLKCLIHAPYVIKNCKTVSSTRVIKKKVKGKMKEVTRFALICEVRKGIKMRVIIEKTGLTGKHQFLSIMPNDKQSKYTKKAPRKTL